MTHNSQNKNNVQKRTYKPTDSAPLTLGPILPIINKCYKQCLFFFNILGENNPQNVVLMVFTIHSVCKKTQILYLNEKENCWKSNFENQSKLIFPTRYPLSMFGHAFMV